MNEETWKKSNAKKLFDCFIEIESSQYPVSRKKELDKRAVSAENLIVEFGVNYVSVTNYTNMMQVRSSISIDVFNSERWQEGNLEIHLGSEPQELWAIRHGKMWRERFNFNTWEWEIEAPLREVRSELA